MTDLTKPVTRRVTTPRVPLGPLIVTMRPEGLEVRYARQRASSARLLAWEAVDWAATKANLSAEQRAVVEPRKRRRRAR